MTEKKKVELEQKEQELESFLAKAKSHRQRWADELKERSDQLEDAILNDSGVFRRSIKARAAEQAEQTWARKVAETEKQLEEVKKELARYQYEEGKAEAHKARREARETLAELEDELLQAIKDCYERGWRAQRDANLAISQANNLAKSVGEQASGIRVGRMDGLSADEFCRGILRGAAREGKL